MLFSVKRPNGIFYNLVSSFWACYLETCVSILSVFLISWMRHFLAMRKLAIQVEYEWRFLRTSKNYTLNNWRWAGIPFASIRCSEMSLVLYITDSPLWLFWQKNRPSAQFLQVWLADLPDLSWKMQFMKHFTRHWLYCFASGVSQHDCSNAEIHYYTGAHFQHLLDQKINVKLQRINISIYFVFILHFIHKNRLLGASWSIRTIGLVK